MIRTENRLCHPAGKIQNTSTELCSDIDLNLSFKPTLRRRKMVSWFSLESRSRIKSIDRFFEAKDGEKSIEGICKDSKPQVSRCSFAFQTLKSAPSKDDAIVDYASLPQSTHFVWCLFLDVGSSWIRYQRPADSGGSLSVASEGINTALGFLNWQQPPQ